MRRVFPARRSRSRPGGTAQSHSDTPQEKLGSTNSPLDELLITQVVPPQSGIAGLRGAQKGRPWARGAPGTDLSPGAQSARPCLLECPRKGKGLPSFPAWEDSRPLLAALPGRVRPARPAADRGPSPGRTAHQESSWRAERSQGPGPEVPRAALVEETAAPRCLAPEDTLDLLLAGRQATHRSCQLGGEEAESK